MKFRVISVFVVLTSTSVLSPCLVLPPVAPPRALRISDPGLLGSLDVEWEPPFHAQPFNECTLRYKFEYRNAGDRDWKVIFTRKLKFRVGFDLSRTAEAKVQTLLEGRCTDHVEVQSEWIEATFQVPLQGKVESEVQDFRCIYHDWQYLRCTWQPGLAAPRGVRYGLYYWYEGLDHAEQCDHYIQDHGINIGCTLQNLSQAEYKDLTICVNGSSSATQLRPLYVTVRLQNLGKNPEQAHPRARPVCEEDAVDEPNPLLSFPIGLVLPPSEAVASGGSVATQMETAFTIPKGNQSHVSCVRVRGRTNIFCADQGFWSEWTQECFSASRKEDKRLFILIPVILSFSCSLIMLMLIGQCRKRTPAGKQLPAPVGC
uniref:Interleukin 13 receptor subunit alpha 2 n=1 Tax=Nothoprocta perdicaria TaxID=30464 RepID=A0A8C6YP31_NOTPE